MGALIVREGTGGIKPLTDRDRREISVTARKLLAADRNPEAVFTATGFQPDGNGGGTVSGTFTLAGVARPLRLRSARPARTAIASPARYVQSDYGIKPYSALPGRAEGTRRGRHRGRHRLVGSGGGAGMTSPEDHAPAAAAAPAAAGRHRLVRAPGGADAGLRRSGRAVAAACHDMAIRFHRGGKLVAFGTGGASTDAQHVAVEFVHPVIVGKRALPAISLTSDIATVTGVASQPRRGRDLRSPDPLPGRARRHRARHLDRRRLRQRPVRAGHRP